MVLVTQSPWDEPPRIRHQIAQQLARFTQVYYVELPTAWRAITRTSMEVVAPNITRVLLGNPHVIPRRMHYWIDPLRGLLNRHYLREIAKLPLSGDKPILINFACEFTEAMSSSLFELTIYFCNDAFTSFATDPVTRRAIARRERRTASAAAHCLTVSTLLAENLMHSNANTTILLPGHDLEARFPGVRRPGPLRIGFLGYLDRRLRYDWLLAAAGAGMEVHLIGPPVVKTPELDQLLAAPRVVAHGTLVGSAMQTILLDMDALVIPYALEGTGMMAMTAPNKLYIYLAAAKPIVVSPFPHFLTFQTGFVYEAQTADGFLEALRRAVAEDNDELRTARLALARANTWDSRGDELRILLEAALAKRLEQ